MRVKLIAAIAFAAAVAVVVVPEGSAGAKIECNGLFSNTTLKSGVVVKDGDFCFLQNVTVNGGLTVTGGTLSVNNSTIHGGWSITGNVTPATYFCGNTIDGGLNVSNVTLGGIALSFGELNSDCLGGTINGGVRISNNDGPVELDGDRVNGGLYFVGVAGYLNELEATAVRGTATCQFVFNDESSPGGSDNSFTGPNNGCPA